MMEQMTGGMMWRRGLDRPPRPHSAAVDSSRLAGADDAAEWGNRHPFMIA
jgi:hypothetical protein